MMRISGCLDGLVRMSFVVFEEAFHDEELDQGRGKQEDDFDDAGPLYMAFRFLEG